MSLFKLPIAIDKTMVETINNSLLMINRIRDELSYNLAIIQQFNLFSVFGRLNRCKVEELPERKENEIIKMTTDIDGRRSIIRYIDKKSSEPTRIYFLRLDRQHEQDLKENTVVLETDTDLDPKEFIKGDQWVLYEVSNTIYQELSEKIFDWKIVKPTVTIIHPDGREEHPNIQLKDVSNYIQFLVEKYRLDFTVTNGFFKLIHPDHNVVYENSQVSHNDILIAYGLEIKFEDRKPFKLTTKEELDQVLDNIEAKIENPSYIIEHYNRLLDYYNRYNGDEKKEYKEIG